MSKQKLDYSKIENISLAGIDTSDYPDFTDAFIEEADYNGRPMTDDELDMLNENRNFVYSAVESYLF